MDESPVLAAALRYAAAGVAVFPSRLYVRGDGRKGVNPISNWDDASSTDPDVIRAWFTGAWRDAALCIDCGKSGIAGVDQDVAEGKDGIHEWDGLEHEKTWTVRSPSGGRHDYYRADPEHPFTVDNTGAVADGVDIRGMGGFLFAPPSIDPRGGSWQWEDGEPDWAALPMVPEVVIKRMEQAAERKRPKSPTPSALPAPSRNPAESASQLFASPSELTDFGPGAGRKKASAAGALLIEELRKFTELTEEGSGRSHILAQKLGVLAGHGVGVFWTYEDALETLMSACAANGFSAVNGESYAQQQAMRGLEYGMREPWIPQPEDVTPADVAAVFGDIGDQPMELPASAEQAANAVDALLGRMLTAEEMCLKPPPEPLIWDLLDRDSIAALIGLPGSFKSFVALDMAGHVGGGRMWRDKRVHRGEVVYIAAEGERGMTLRIRAWQQKNGPMTGVRFLPEPVQIRDPVAWRVLIEACRRIQPVMVVIDTQAMVSVGMEENSNTEMSVVIDAFKAIKRATGACVLVVHHTTKAGDSTRGASAQDGAQDTRLKLERANPRSSMVVKLIEGKQKDMAEGEDGGEAMMLETVELGTDPITGRRLSSLVVVDFNAVKAAAGSAVIAPEDAWEPPVESVRDLVLRVLADHGEERGVTSADARKIVLERWYGQDASRLLAGTWRSAWNRAIKREDVLNVGGERYTIDPLSQSDIS